MQEGIKNTEKGKYTGIYKLLTVQNNKCNIFRRVKSM